MRSAVPALLLVAALGSAAPPPALDSPQTKELLETLRHSDEGTVDCYAATSTFHAYGLDLSPAKSANVLFGEKRRCLPAAFLGKDQKLYRITSSGVNPATHEAWVAVVPQGEVQETRPAADQMLRQLRADLASKGPYVVAQSLERATTTYPDSPELWTFRAAVLEAIRQLPAAYDAARQVAALAKQGKTFKPDEPEPLEPAVPVAGQTVYVSATRLRLRAEPKDAAAIAGYLPINARAKVVAVRSPWVQLEPAQLAPAQDESWEVTAKRAKKKPKQGASERTGWAPAAYLSAQPLSVSALLQEAATDEGAKKWPEAARALERAATLQPPEDPVRQRLVRALANSGEYGAAAAWSLVPEQALKQPYARIAVREVLGCRGDRSKAALVYPEPAAAPFPCEEEGCAIPPELTKAYPSNACAIGVAPECRWCGSVMDKAMDSGDGVVDQVRGEYRLHRLQRLFKDGPWVLAEVQAPSAPAGAKTKLYPFLAEVEECGETRAKTKRLDVYAGVALPVPGAKQRLWIRHPMTESATFGVIAADSPAEAKKKARATVDAGCTGTPSWIGVTADVGCTCPWPRDFQVTIGD